MLRGTMHLIRLAGAAPGLAHYVRLYAHQQARLGNDSLVRQFQPGPRLSLNFNSGIPARFTGATGHSWKGHPAS